MSALEEHLYKVLVIGDFGVGKTSIIRRFAEDVFSPNYKLTIGVDFSLKTIQWDSTTKINLQLWDIAGHERFGHMTRVYYKYAIAAIIVFDITRKVTFESVLRWLEDVAQKVMLENEEPVPVILLANKCDLENTEVEHHLIDSFCQIHKICKWFPTSAKNNINIVGEEMSSFAKRAKSLKRTHRERGQLRSRAHLGLLEKHKDYVLRARDYQRKKDQLKILQEKARNRNPDEFYYKMVNTKLEDGKHIIPEPEENFTPEQLLLMKTQDVKYVQMKTMMERKKIERLQSSLHLLSKTETPVNTRVVFVDPSEANNSELSLPTTNDCRDKDTSDHVTEGQNKMYSSGYRELHQRINRCNELKRVAHKMITQKNLMSGGKCKRIPGDDRTPVAYKWQKERKK